MLFSLKHECWKTVEYIPIVYQSTTCYKLDLENHSYQNQRRLLVKPMVVQRTIPELSKKSNRKVLILRG